MMNGFRKIVTAEELLAAEKTVMNELGIPQGLLMEHAAMAVANEIPEGSRVLLLCGSGCNGADAIACGRLLLRKGCRTDYMTGFSTSHSAAWEEQWNYLKPYMTAETKVFSFGQRTLLCYAEYDYIVDGVFGIGLNREVSEELRELFSEINRLTKRPKVIAIDVPSGIHATSGKRMGEALLADVTVTFTAIKTGLLLYPGRRYAGEVHVADVGVTDKAVVTERFMLAEPMEEWLPKRNADGHKGSFGKLLLYAGCEDMPGAAVLCAKACYRSGAGLVKVVSDTEVLRTLHELVPEAVGAAFEKHSQEELSGYSVLIIGPGLGKSAGAVARFERALQFAGRRVLDADALNLLAQRMDAAGMSEWEERVAYLNELLSPETVLTPHRGELSRLLGLPIAELGTKRFAMAECLRTAISFVLIWKDACTIVIGNGRMYLNSTGNEAMATAGSGDVLAGICGAFAAVESDLFSAACKAVYVHGAAGDRCKQEIGSRATMAGDLADALRMIL